MESSNSGSIQSSSSGADNEDYTSHAESFSSFLNLPPPLQPPQLMTAGSHHHSNYSTAATSSFFDPLSPFFAHFPPFLPPPPDPNPLGHFVDIATRPNRPTNSGRSSPSPSHPNCTTAVDVSATSASSFSSTLSPVQQSDHGAAAAGAPRGSKKRSRASRRAPTTVLTTDTSNFRAMVQQFTGFPAPPFAPSSSSMSAYSRPRLDLFNLGASASPASPFNNLLRPFPQKFQHPLIGASSSSSSLMDAIASIARSSVGHLSMPLNAAGSASTSAPPFNASTSSSRNLQFPPSDLQNRSPMHAQNASIDSQSMLQPHDISKLYAPQSSSSSSLPTLRAQQQGPSGGGALGTAPQGVKSIHRPDGLSSWIDRQSTERRDEARQEPANQSFGAYKASE